MCKTRIRSMKTLEEMDVIDDFLFVEIMTDDEYGKEVCRMILSLVLKREIGEINYTAQKVVPGISESSHGIRMDAYITEHLSEEGTDRPDVRVYDIEPDTQSKKKKLAKHLTISFYMPVNKAGPLKTNNWMGKYDKGLKIE